MTIEAKKMMCDYYHKGNFPMLVAHSDGWDIYAKAEKDENGSIYCAAIPTTPDRLPHGYGTIHHVSRMIMQGHLRPVIGNLHLATA
jgi:hypothetical protein